MKQDIDNICQNTCAIIVAGGSGQRFGNPLGKQFVDICNKPMIAWSIKAFDECERVGCIVIVTAKDRLEDARRVASKEVVFNTEVKVVPSGDTRQISVLNGIGATDKKYKYVAIHDGARPLIRVSTINSAIDALCANDNLDGVVCGQPAIDTLKLVSGKRIEKTPDRSLYWAAQTPQIFKLDKICEAHQYAIDNNIVATDDSSLVEVMGGHMEFVESPRDNIKVTVPEDLRPVQAILEGRLTNIQDKGDLVCE